MIIKSVMAAALALSVAAVGFVAPSQAQANANSPLVNGEWLEKNLSDPKLRIVEVSVEPGLFERGHIPGAQNVVWHTDLVDTVKRDVASKEKFQDLVKKLGINQDSTVVLYGDNNNWFAAWGAWVFDVYGVKNVKLLDGGRKKWEADKRRSTRAMPAWRPVRSRWPMPIISCVPVSPMCARRPTARISRSSISARRMNIRARSLRRPARRN